MTTIFQQAASRIAHAAQGITDTDLAGIVGGVEPGELQLSGSVLPGVAITLPFSPCLQQLPVGAVEPHGVPWAELKPAVKKLAADDSIGPSA